MASLLLQKTLPSLLVHRLEDCGLWQRCWRESAALKPPRNYRRNRVKGQDVQKPRAAAVSGASSPTISRTLDKERIVQIQRT